MEDHSYKVYHLGKGSSFLVRGVKSCHLTGEGIKNAGKV